MCDCGGCWFKFIIDDGVIGAKFDEVVGARGGGGGGITLLASRSKFIGDNEFSKSLLLLLCWGCCWFKSESLRIFGFVGFIKGDGRSLLALASTEAPRLPACEPVLGCWKVLGLLVDGPKWGETYSIGGVGCKTGEVKGLKNSGGGGIVVDDESSVNEGVGLGWEKTDCGVIAGDKNGVNSS